LRLSVILITKNEASNIRDCLESVSWADEIVVVDSNSTDSTREVARQYTSQVFDMDWPGFGPQKNRALARANGDWVFSIDADERVTPELRAEIERIIAQPGDRVAFELPRRSSYCGTFMRHGGWSPDYVTRLFRRERGRFSDDLVHERVIVNGATGRLANALTHYSYLNPEEVLDKVNSYSSASARMMREAGKRSGLASAVLHGLWSFFRTYVLRLGFLDGRAGFMLAVSNAETSYYRYVKLMLLQQGH
jgi:glycosyltransferase involved in cell wall biosynthesis